MNKISLINLGIVILSTIAVVYNVYINNDSSIIPILILLLIMSVVILTQTIYQFKLDIGVNRSKYTSVNIKSQNKRRG